MRFRFIKNLLELRQVPARFLSGSHWQTPAEASAEVVPPGEQGARLTGARLTEVRLTGARLTGFQANRRPG